MTQDISKDATVDSALPVVVPETFEQKCVRILGDNESKQVLQYLEKGGKRLASDTASAFFQLFLNGSDTREIHRLNKPFPYEAIALERVRGDWDVNKLDYQSKLQEGIKDKLIKANLETIGLLTDMLAVANKQHGDKFKKYLQTGNEKDLEGSMKAESIHQILKVLEGLYKAAGIEKPKDAGIINNIQVNAQSIGSVGIPSSDAAKNLAAVASQKRGASK